MAVPRRLADDALAQYRADGYFYPIEVLSGATLAATQAAFRSLLAANGLPLSPAHRHKPHLYLKWAADLVRHPALIGAASDLLGPDVLVWRSTFFIKAGGDPQHVPWHQDSVYWKFAGNEVLTAWVALTDSTTANGCVSVVPGSHRAPEQRHRVNFDKHNALLRGQSLDTHINERDTVAMQLRAGQASLHDLRMIHGSPANPSDQLRAGLAIRYIAATAWRRGPRESATLVAGTDGHAHFDHEILPEYDNDPTALACHRRSVRRYTRQVLVEMLRHPKPREIAAFLHKTLARRGSRSLARDLLGG